MKSPRTEAVAMKTNTAYAIMHTSTCCYCFFGLLRWVGMGCGNRLDLLAPTPPYLHWDLSLQSFLRLGKVQRRGGIDG